MRTLILAGESMLRASGEISLSKALTIMNKGVPATGKERLELARPLFEEAVVNADLLIKSTVRKELRKVIEELEKLSVRNRDCE